MYFQDLILTLQNYWREHGCLLTQPYDTEKGAGTFNPNTFLRALGPEPFHAAYVEPCRRPTDGRYGDNPIRLQHYFQFQVVMKPAPKDIVELYLGSLKAIGITPEDHDLRFVHDDWESPTLGAWGLGWEVWADGMEVTQFTYFQQVGGLELAPIMGEITYGLERLCMFLQGVDKVYDLAYNEQFTYGDLYHQNEVLGSRHNFEQADIALHRDWFARCEGECRSLCQGENPVAALDYCLKASHAFNLLDARGAISVNERQAYILRVRALARAVAEAWLAHRQSLGFPLTARDRTEAAQDKPVRAPVSEPPEVAPWLLELGVEEMPAQVFASLHEQLPRLFAKHFDDCGLEPSEPTFYSTPRRFTICVDRLRTRQADQDLEVKGPPLKVAKKDGQWTRAATGFAAKNGLTVDDLEVRELGGAEYLFACRHEVGKGAAEVLAEVVPAFLGDLHWYKTMRWHRGDGPGFVRPVRWLVAKLGEQVLPLSFAGVPATGESYGHRFLANHPLPVPADREGYLDTLRNSFVNADPAERRELILHQIEELAADEGLAWREDEALLAEVVNLVEHPRALLCRFAPEFLEIPEEVLVSEMRDHQRYLALKRPDGSLANHFIAVSNMLCRDLDLVQEGYEKVLRSRFADARFFLAEDRKRPLAERVGELEQRVFQADLGSILDKVRRVEALAVRLAERLGLGSAACAQVAQIARLAKADLGTAMVGEFPELQGEIGRYYALQEGLDPVVADGIRDHYRPRHVDDAYPGSAEAAIVALADRLDSLVGLFAVGKAPSSSADPFALRRACLTSIAILVNRDFHLDLGEAFDEAWAGYRERLPQVDAAALREQLLEFTLARARILFAERSRPGIPGGFAKDTIAAVTNADAPWADLSDLARRLVAMGEFRRRPDFPDVAATFKRCNNILAGAAPTGEIDPTLFADPAEGALHEAVGTARAAIAKAVAAGDYVQALAAVAPLRETADAFFEAVMVNDPDEARRANRQRLLAQVVAGVRQVADFAAIQE